MCEKLLLKLDTFGICFSRAGGCLLQVRFFEWQRNGHRLWLQSFKLKLFKRLFQWVLPILLLHPVSKVSIDLLRDSLRRCYERGWITNVQWPLEECLCLTVRLPHVMPCIRTNILPPMAADIASSNPELRVTSTLRLHLSEVTWRKILIERLGNRVELVKSSFKEGRLTRIQILFARMMRFLDNGRVTILDGWNWFVFMRALRFRRLLYLVWRFRIWHNPWGKATVDHET